MEKLRNNKGYHGSNGQRQKLLVRCCHFHNQYGARDRRTHGGGKERRHSNDYDVGSIDFLNNAQSNQYMGTDAAGQGPNNQHGQKEATGHAAAVADQGEKEFTD